MKKTCDDYINEFLMLDKNQRIPFSLSLHLLKCKECRNLVRSLTKAEKIAAKPLKISVPANSESITNIVLQIDPEYNPKTAKVSFANWIISGIILIASMIFVNWLTKGISTSLLSFLIVMCFAGLLVFYFVSFIYSNIDFFVKKIGPNLQA